MKNKLYKKRNYLLTAVLLILIFIGGCTSAADTASYNISKESDEFRVVRRVVFYNSLTDTYLMEMTGNMSIDLSRDNVLEVTAKVGPDEYQKHYLGLSDNVTYTVEQIGTSDVSEYKYEMIFKPESIIPIEIEYKKGEEKMNTYKDMEDK
ncbi:hypothetical protein [Carnobacterium inhibens]|uniref:beta-sandwich lipoprotein n=1 Tax=Carnobacterium inhibens TaxID=147709 RepID=UPI00203E6A49|nr:hypothetical protein [Carnobacterium inhibens]MCM3511662.1 hypothetical protein [Carnobacterium inhibens]